MLFPGLRFAKLAVAGKPRQWLHAWNKGSRGDDFSEAFWFRCTKTSFARFNSGLAGANRRRRGQQAFEPNTLRRH
jgi:hypothetical protein